ncbi:SOS response-associated peptidase [Salinirubellus sp. GCM10025818]|uniref:SOS response-associated peptidase n=1 Tax=Salinirubellus TaxID=2162630 RepID=UPI0030D2CFCC
MCGRYTVTASADELEARFDASFDEPFRPRYNAAPGQVLPVVTNEAPETIQFLRWGLIPSWADDDSGGQINARAETVAEKPSFAAAYDSRRCLVLVDGFYEWREAASGKRPYRVTLAGGEPFAVAGLWERWTPTRKQTGLDEFGDGSPDRSVEPLETFTIVTTEPNDLVADYHHRMAVILPEGIEREWLTAEDPRHLLEPYPAERMRAYPVSTAVNDPSNDSPSLIEPVG